MGRDWLSGAHAFILASPGTPEVNLKELVGSIAGAGFEAAWVHAALWQSGPGGEHWTYEQVRELTRLLWRHGVVPLPHFWLSRAHAAEHDRHLADNIERAVNLGMGQGAYGDAAEAAYFGHRVQAVNIWEYYRRLREGLPDAVLLATFAYEAEGLCRRIGTQDVDWSLTPEERIDDLVARAQAYDAIYRRPDGTPIHRYKCADLGWLMLTESAYGPWLPDERIGELYNRVYNGVRNCPFPCAPTVQAHYHQWTALTGRARALMRQVNEWIMEEDWKAREQQAQDAAAGAAEAKRAAGLRPMPVDPNHTPPGPHGQMPDPV